MISQMARMMTDHFQGSSASYWGCWGKEGGRVRPSAEGIYILGNLDRTSSFHLHTLKWHNTSVYHLSRRAASLCLFRHLWTTVRRV